MWKLGRSTLEEGGFGVKTQMQGKVNQPDGRTGSSASEEGVDEMR